MIAVKLPKNTAMACAQSGRDGKDNAWLVVAVICKMGLPPIPLKGDGDKYIMIQCLFVTFLFIPALPPSPVQSCYDGWIKRKVESRK